jgi:transposase-like protein
MILAYYLFMETQPKTLQEAVVYFSDAENCRKYVQAWRWPNGVVCPTCGSTKVKLLEKHNRWQCSTHHPKRQFSAKVGTIFEDSPLGLDKWLVAMWLIANCKNGISSSEIARALGITQKTAWFMDHRIRLSMQDDFYGSKLGGEGGEVEVDETFIGGKARNMHASKKRGKGYQHRGIINKTVVMGMLQRGGKVKTTVIKERDKGTLHGHVQACIEEGTNLYTDKWGPYTGLDEQYVHQVINHAERYVDGRVHTNVLENFWSLLKRGLSGTYVSVEPFHLFRYLDEQAFRFNNRKATDADRFNMALLGVVGKRVTYKELTGKEANA